MEKEVTEKTHKVASRSEDDFHLLMNRLNRIEGQIHGIRGMLEKDRTSQDILIQVTAVTAALNSFNKELLGTHIRSNFVKDIKAGKSESVDELITLVHKLMK